MSRRRICAWCTPPHDLGPAPDGCGGDTHTMCDAAAARVLAQVGASRSACVLCGTTIRGLPRNAWVVCHSGGHEVFAWGVGAVDLEAQARSSAMAEHARRGGSLWRWMSGWAGAPAG